MKSLRRLGNEPTSLPLSADDVTELHAARILLLIHVCGSKGRIHGLTKLAKLDFFVRYPSFFNQVAVHIGKSESPQIDQVESSMVRHHYGPWDKRYYQVLAFNESRRLLSVVKHKNAFEFILTDLGRDKAKILSKQKAFGQLVIQMKSVKKALGRKSGTQLKNLVYEVFDVEVKELKLGDVIR